MQPDIWKIGPFRRPAQAFAPASMVSSPLTTGIFRRGSLPRRCRVIGRARAAPRGPNLLVICYLNNPTNITHVITANAINNVLWPHLATIPTMFLS